MSHPPFWLSKQFFYPIGNTAAISLTQDLSPEQSAADILLLGCGDPRNILFTLYSDLTIGTRKLDITCCDIEPAVLARNILLFSLLDQNENIDRVWDIFYHFKIDDRALKIITRQSQTLYDHADTIETWQGSVFGSFLRMEDARTLMEIRRHWKGYADFPSLPASRKNQIMKEQVQLSKSNADKGAMALSPSRSAGMLWPQAMKPVADLFRKYWETGTTFTLASDIKNATNLNPTFVYSLSGEGFNPHYGTFPSGFHLTPAFAPLKSDPTGPTPSTGSAAISTSKKQFAAWIKAFREARKSESIVIRFFAGDAIAFCRALDHFKRNSDPKTDLFISAYRATQINFDGHAIGDSIPTTFDIIDTSNLTDHLGLFNLLLVTHSLLKKTPQSQAVLYTETLLPTGKDATKSFLERIFTDVPTIAMLFGIVPRPFVSGFTTHSNAHELMFSEHIEQYHERAAWTNPSGGDNLILGHEVKTISFEADSLARILYGIYDNMFANEKVTSLMSSLSFTPNGLRALGTIHFQRETIALFLQALRDQTHLVNGDWEQVANRFIHTCRSDSSRIIKSNCYQDICLQFHLYGILTVDTLKPNWALDPGLRVSPRNALFDD